MSTNIIIVGERKAGAALPISAHSLKNVNTFSFQSLHEPSTIFALQKVEEPSL